jgi:hypothetical protein
MLLQEFLGKSPAWRRRKSSAEGEILVGTERELFSPFPSLSTLPSSDFIYKVLRVQSSPLWIQGLFFITQTYKAGAPLIC